MLRGPRPASTSSVCAPARTSVELPPLPLERVWRCTLGVAGACRRPLRFEFVARARKLTLEDYAAQPWRNGRGRTLEIARAGGVDFEWRVSAAGVAEDGPFSAFDGCERVLVVTAGNGLVLEFAGGRRERLRPLEPFAFAGAPPPSARLVRGPVEDLGVIARSASWRPSMQALRLGRRALRCELSAGELALVHALGAGLRARVSGEEEPFECAPRDTLVLEQARAGDEVELTGQSDASICVWIALKPA
ncbi:MAG: HutD family protein [Planctomycetota bacterium]|nr:MAG: HutD family protein [Planctomycetota bacterium]